MTEQTSQQNLVIGDRVRLKSRMANQHQSFKELSAEVATFREPMEGMVLSIRNVKTGQLLAQATGNLEDYVIEIIYDHTFNAKFASLRNAPRGSDSPTSTPGWKRLHAALRAATDKGQLFSTALLTATADSTLLALMDGWKVIKVWSNEIETLQRPEPAQEAAAG